MATIIITASCVFLAGAFILYMQGMLDCLFHKDYRNNVDFKLGNLIKEFIFQDYQNIVDSKLGKMIEEFDELLSDTETFVEKQERLEKENNKAIVSGYMAKHEIEKRRFDEWRQRELLKSVGFKTKAQCMIDDMDKWVNTKTVSDWKAVAMQEATKEFYTREIY